MTKRTFVALCGTLALFACKGEDEDTDTDPPTGDCAVTLDDSVPGDGATGVYYRSSLSYEFSEADTSLDFMLTDAAGAEVAGAGEWVDEIYVWTPNDPLAPSTTYDASLTWCDGAGSNTRSFTTSAVGEPVDVAAVPGNTYALDVASGTFVEPPGVGALLGSFLTVDILLGVTGADATSFDTMGAISIEGSDPPEQDLCTPSIPFPSADFTENPFFELGPQATTISVQGVNITIDDLYVSGALASDGSAIQGASLAGFVDTRPLVPLIQPGGPDEAVCDTVAAVGIACETCPDGQDFCLSLVVEDISADLVASVTLVERSETDIAGDTACQ